MSGSDQTTLGVTATEADQSRYTPLALRDRVGDDEARDMMASFGIDPDHIGVDASALDEAEKGALHRYQYDRVYIYPRRAGPNNTEYEPIEFRTYIVTVGQPTDELKAFIDRQMNGRLRTLFNSGPYQGYMEGFNFVDSLTNIEDDSIAVDEANNIGVPQFEVLVTKGSRVQGQSTGFAYPFEVRETTLDEENVPQNEVWGLAKQGDRYRIAPPGRTNSRQRAEAIRGKSVYVNGALIGTMAAGGRAWLRNEYQSSDQMYRGQHSRRWLINNTGATSAAIRDGGNLYKVRETNDRVELVTASDKPDDFDPTDPDDVSEDAVVAETTTIETVEFAEETTFDIRDDSGAMLGRYDTPMKRDISDTTDFILR